MTDITENNKFYTPDISELDTPVEFNYSPYGWDTLGSESGHIEHFKNELKSNPENFRVKRLCNEDILAEGWELHNKPEMNQDYFLKDSTWMWESKGKWTIERNDGEYNGKVFHGTILNRHDLKRLMGQLGVK